MVAGGSPAPHPQEAVTPAAAAYDPVQRYAQMVATLKEHVVQYLDTALARALRQGVEFDSGDADVYERTQPMPEQLLPLLDQMEVLLKHMTSNWSDLQMHARTLPVDQMDAESTRMRAREDIDRCRTAVQPLADLVRRMSLAAETARVAAAAAAEAARAAAAAAAATAASMRPDAVVDRDPAIQEEEEEVLLRMEADTAAASASIAAPVAATVSSASSVSSSVGSGSSPPQEQQLQQMTEPEIPGTDATEAVESAAAASAGDSDPSELAAALDEGPADATSPAVALDAPTTPAPLSQPPPPSAQSLDDKAMEVEDETDMLLAAETAMEDIAAAASAASATDILAPPAEAAADNDDVDMAIPVDIGDEGVAVAPPGDATVSAGDDNIPGDGNSLGASGLGDSLLSA